MLGCIGRSGVTPILSCMTSGVRSVARLSVGSGEQICVPCIEKERMNLLHDSVELVTYINIVICS